MSALFHDSGGGVAPLLKQPAVLKQLDQNSPRKGPASPGKFPGARRKGRSARSSSFSSSSSSSSSSSEPGSGKDVLSGGGVVVHDDAREKEETFLADFNSILNGPAGIDSVAGLVQTAHRWIDEAHELGYVSVFRSLVKHAGAWCCFGGFNRSRCWSHAYYAVPPSLFAFKCSRRYPNFNVLPSCSPVHHHHHQHQQSQ